MIIYLEVQSKLQDHFSHCQRFGAKEAIQRPDESMYKRESFYYDQSAL
ncbi:hypothetical protein LIER_04714 [Lithospermum erythrorhizon]|uniref:Uncharacterized protein n=1 Tax=Lithospermum erythrorhizon TaxID=34254 RepID=A0AAV3P2G8_LITER